MANQTIYPYGTGGQLPSSIGIINDLTTGGADKALSAEMGKRLGPLDDLVADVTNVTEVEFTNGKYYKNYGKAVGNSYTGDDITSTDTYACAKVSAQVGDVVTIWVYDVPNTAFPYVMCDADNVVTAVSPKSSSATGYTKAKSDPWVLNIEEDGYIYINTRTNGGDGGGCTVARAAREVVKADSTHDGIMTKEQAVQLESVAGEDGDLTTLKSYLADNEDTIIAEWDEGYSWRNYNSVNVGSSYVGSKTEMANMYCAKVQVYAGDTATIWCSAWNTSYPWVLTNAQNIVVSKSAKSTSADPYTISKLQPAVLEIAADGWLYIDARNGADFGCEVIHSYRGIRLATAEQDGLMPKEIAAMFDTSSGDEGSFLLKGFGVIGDSFSAPGTWQNKMCQILGASLKSNKAVSGGAWHGTDNLSAYYQAGKLIETGVQFDYILCTLGTNDIAHWSTYTLGDIVNSETIGTEPGNVNPNGSITGGIQATLIRLKNAFPNAIIKIGYTPAGYIHDAFNSIANVEALCNRLKELSHIYGVGYIETRDCGICPWMEADLHAYTGTTTDSVWTATGHPSGAGQTRIGQYMARIMMSNL